MRSARVPAACAESTGASSEGGRRLLERLLSRRLVITVKDVEGEGAYPHDASLAHWHRAIYTHLRTRALGMFWLRAHHLGFPLQPFPNAGLMLSDAEIGSDIDGMFIFIICSLPVCITSSSRRCNRRRKHEAVKDSPHLGVRLGEIQEIPDTKVLGDVCGNGPYGKNPI